MLPNFDCHRFRHRRRFTAAVTSLPALPRPVARKRVLPNRTSLNETYYIGVKSEDQESAEFAFLAVATDQPFGQVNPDGSVDVTMLTPFPAPIPDGSPASPGSVIIIGVTTLTDPIRRVVVTNSMTHENFGDLIVTLEPWPDL